MLQKTLCWKCNKEYNLDVRQCYGCGASNANVDLIAAMREALDEVELLMSNDNLFTITRKLKERN